MDRRFLFRKPDEREIRHASRALLIMLSATLLPIVVGLPSARFVTSKLSLSAGPATAAIITIFIMGAWFSLGALIGWQVGDSIDRRTSRDFRHLIFYATDVWLVSAMLTGTAWSFYHFFTVPSPVSKIFLPFGIIFLLITIDVVIFGGGKKMRSLLLWS